ncbi:MAG: hypothetical protein PHY92_05240 [Alphaproteobacteria bacterium]|nr:hypothetical protein [Alphaproteobacteria bacterium]
MRLHELRRDVQAVAWAEKEKNGQPDDSGLNQNDHGNFPPERTGAPEEGRGEARQGHGPNGYAVH